MRPAAFLVAFLACSEEARTQPMVSADVHLHNVCPSGQYATDDLFQRMAAEDVQIGATLVAAQNVEALSAIDGRDLARDGRLLRTELEVSGFYAARQGHLVLHGLSFVARETVESPRALAPILDWAVAQSPRVFAGYAHGWAWPERGYPTMATLGCCTPLELPIDVARGRVVYLAEEANERNAMSLGVRFDGSPLATGTFALWRTLMNAGYPLGLAAGSDLGCIGDTVGMPRTLAIVDGEVTYPSFLDALRNGRTAVASTKGWRLDMRAGDRRLGETIALDAPADIVVELGADLAEPAPVQVLVNGVLVRDVAFPPGPRTMTTTVRIEKSSWVVARTRHVVTSAIYAIVSGRPIRASADDACFLMKYVDHLRTMVTTVRPDSPLFLGAELPAASARWGEARADFERRFREAGGTDCR